tara:strand:+ start:110 stop:2068 length:1959 start_codon:yes stop_codon:yes gene_type:complete
MTFKKRLAVLISGNGTNLQAILDSCKSKFLNCQVSLVLSNNKKAYGLTRAKLNNVPTEVLDHREYKEREDYDQGLIRILDNYNPHLIVLAGWMRILTPSFLNHYNKRVINLHPALPNSYIGVNAIRQAYDEFKSKDDNTRINNTGVNVHYVIPELDRGESISSIIVPINDNDSYDDLEQRVHKYEKMVLVNSIKMLTDEYNFNVNDKTPNMENAGLEVYRNGKVRDVYELDKNVLVIDHSNRLSSFDRYICDIPNKGTILNKLSVFWFERLKKDLNINSHYLWSHNNLMFAKNCRVFQIEVVVRGFITGNTKTSLWTHYKNGKREYCGIHFPPGLVKNQRLDYPVITPTTKGVEDVPISAEEIVNQGYMTKEQWDKISNMAMRIFKYGQEVAEKQGLLLVDTKYEFGIDNDNNIIIVDEVHTCDSSRFWIKDTYNDRFNNNEEPDKYDKDVVRDWIKKNYDDPYSMSNFNIPAEMINKTENVYMQFYKRLVDLDIHTISDNYNSENWKMTDVVNHFNINISKYFPTVVILAGSESDMPHIEKISNACKNLDLYTKIHISSAHKNTEKVLEILNMYNNQNGNVVFVTVAGRSNALSGVVACNTQYPTIACPPFSDKVDMMVNINSTLQMPSKVPVMTILEPGNVALAIKRMFQ